MKLLITLSKATLLAGCGAIPIYDISRAWASTDAFMEESIGRDNAQKITELTRQLRDAHRGRKPDNA